MNAPDPFAVVALDALPSHVAVLDEAGRVVAVNKRWRRFGRANGATSDYVGSNYFDTCARTVQEDRAAMRASNGLRRLIAGEIDTFGLVYICALRVFRLRASRICEGPWRVLVAHEDITTIQLAADEAKRELRLLKPQINGATRPPVA